MATERFSPVGAVNASGAEVPRYAAVEPTGGVDADGRLQVAKATRSNSVAVLFNGPTPVPDGGRFDAWPPTPAAVAGVSVGDGGADPGDLPLAAGAAMGTRAGDWFLRAGQAGFRAVAPPTLGAVQVVTDPVGDAGGFYAALSGASSPYGFAEVAGPAVGSATVVGGRTGTANAYEQLTGLTGIPAGTVVWMYAGTTAQPYRFNCIAVTAGTGVLEAGSAACTVRGQRGVVAYVSARNLCGVATALPSLTDYAIPSTCVDMVTGGSIACVSGAPVLTLTTTKVRVLACGAC